MKKIFGLGLLALSISACNSGMATNSSGEISSNAASEMRIKELKDSLKSLQDSLLIDSLRTVDTEKTLALEQERESEKKSTATPVHSNQIHSAANSSAPQPTPVAKKKGWSGAAKGTAIGAGVGAGVGALIDKDKRLRGAAIGAVIGGGSGYAIGKKSDNKK